MGVLRLFHALDFAFAFALGFFFFKQILSFLTKAHNFGL
jgi:hypothetical protein